MHDSNTHPLLPGIRCTELHNPDWPRTLHDGQLTGFSPLTCNMSGPPKVWATLDAGGEVRWIEPVTTADGQAMLLVCDSRLRLVSPDGEVLWNRPETGSLCFFGDLRGNGRDGVLLGRGPYLVLLDAVTGQTEWTHRFEPPYVQVRVAVGNVLPDRSGLEAAVFLAYGDEGCLFHFPPEGDPRVVWRRAVVVPGEWPERYDHGCDIKLDLSEPDEPVIWNVRHHRCRGFHARTGELASALAYRIDDERLRNYGVWDLGRGKDGRPLICMVAEQVQTHVHAVRLNRDGENELAWFHYYGEIYIVPGVAVAHIAIADVDGDGETEIVYNVRDPAQDFRSFVRVRSGDTGVVKAELKDAWGIGMGPERSLLVLPAPDGATPVFGDLTVYWLRPSGDPVPVAILERTGVWGAYTIGQDLLLRRTGMDGRSALVRYALRDGGLQEVAHTTGEALLEAPIHTVLGAEAPVVLAPTWQGALNALRWQGERLWQLPLSGGAAPTLSAADLNADGRAELVAATAGNRVRIFSLGPAGEPEELANHQFLGARARHSPLLCDLESVVANRSPYCLVAPGSTEQGDIVVRAYRADGTLLWETALGISTAQNGMAVAWNAGRFLPGLRTGVAVSVNNALRTVEGTCLLDGVNGKVLWHRDNYWKDGQVRPYLPHGIPSAFDFNGDGLDEIMMDMLSYMAVLRGVDGGFVFLKHTENLGKKDALYAGNLYNSYVPVYRSPDDREPHWFVPLGGYGSFGLMKPDPGEGIWREDPGYDIPPKIGLIDVDGDGVLEVGYALLNSPVFTCRNLWTGEIKWELCLPEAPDSPVLVADVDGDGKGEFLTGRYCIGTNADGHGEIRWESPVPLGWASIADFDGDGAGEIACASPGTIYILKGREYNLKNEKKGRVDGNRI